MQELEQELIIFRLISVLSRELLYSIHLEQMQMVLRSLYLQVCYMLQEILLVVLTGALLTRMMIILQRQLKSRRRTLQEQRFQERSLVL